MIFVMKIYRTSMVLGFSIGLAMTLVSVGTSAALSVKHASKKFKRFGEFVRKVPYANSIVFDRGDLIA